MPPRDHRRQRLEVAEELPRVGSQPKSVPVSGELDRARAARRQVAALPGARAHDPAAGDQERQRRSGVRRLSRGARRDRAPRRARRLVRGAADAPDGRAARRRTGCTIRPAPRSEWDHGTYHIFARTFNAPHVWYYRRLENGRTWTPWEKIDADIEGEHLAPGGLQPADAPVLDDVPRGDQADAAAEAGRQGTAAARSARTGKSSSPTRCTTAAAGRASGCRRAAWSICCTSSSRRSSSTTRCITKRPAAACSRPVGLHAASDGD